jgi:hypothetical protein
MEDDTDLFLEKNPFKPQSLLSTRADGEVSDQEVPKNQSNNNATDQVDPLSEYLSENNSSAKLNVSKLKQIDGMEHVSKLDVLWNICESSQSRVKLILADSLETPFYLAKKKTGFREKTVAEIEREGKRIEFLIMRDIGKSSATQEKIRKKHTVKNVEELLPAHVQLGNLTPREK